MWGSTGRLCILAGMLRSERRAPDLDLWGCSPHAGVNTHIETQTHTQRDIDIHTQHHTHRNRCAHHKYTCIYTHRGTQHIRKPTHIYHTPLHMQRFTMHTHKQHRHTLQITHTHHTHHTTLHTPHHTKT